MRNGILSLSADDEPRSVTNGTVLVASTDPRFPPATASAAIHRCEYDPATGSCALCGETHDTAGLALSIAQDGRYVREDSTNMIRFVASPNGGVPESIVWQITPQLPDGALLSEQPDEEGEYTVSGCAAVWADAGMETNSYAVSASYAFAPEVSASQNFTAVAIDAEPICTETDDAGFVVNPCMVPIGQTATFRIKVFPASVPNNDIRWTIADGGVHAEFVGSRYGREITLRGKSEGSVLLRVDLTGYLGVSPTFETYVADMIAVPVDAWIVTGANGPVYETDSLSDLIQSANAILRQICMTCYVNQVYCTNRSDWVDLSVYTDAEYENVLDLIASVSNRCNGLELHFVGELKSPDLGSNNRNGIVLSASANGQTLAHEIGHAIGLKDIYGVYFNPNMIVDLPVRRSWEPSDWSGNDPQGFYQPEYSQVNLVRRLIMCGDGNAGCRDFSAGPVYGIIHDDSSPTGFSFGHSSVGVKPFETRRIPRHD